jgi:hypothetical protein
MIHRRPKDQVTPETPVVSQPLEEAIPERVDIQLPIETAGFDAKLPAQEEKHPAAGKHTDLAYGPFKVEASGDRILIERGSSAAFGTKLREAVFLSMKDPESGYEIVVIVAPGLEDVVEEQEKVKEPESPNPEPIVSEEVADRLAGEGELWTSTTHCTYSSGSGLAPDGARPRFTTTGKCYTASLGRVLQADPRS